MLLPEVELDFAIAAPMDLPQSKGRETILRDKQQAEQLGRKVKVLGDQQQDGPDIVRLAQEGNYNLIVLPTTGESRTLSAAVQDDWASFVLQNTPCSIFLASHP